MQTFDLSSPDKTQEILARASSDSVRIECAGKAGDFRASCSRGNLKSIRLFSLKAQSIFAMHPESNEFLGVTVPIRGSFRVFGQDFDVDHAHILRTQTPFELESRSSEIIVANFFGSRIERYLRLRGDNECCPSNLKTKLDLRSPAGEAFGRMTRFIFGEIKRDSPSIHSPLAASNLEDAFYLVLAEAMSDNQSDKSDGHPRALPRAMEYARENLSEYICRADLAEAAGTSVRTLTRSFQKAVGLSPMQWVRQMRLHEARSALLNGDSTKIRIIDVALHAGFGSPATFTRHYGEQFGECPSATLRKNRS